MNKKFLATIVMLFLVSFFTANFSQETLASPSKGYYYKNLSSSEKKAYNSAIKYLKKNHNGKSKKISISVAGRYDKYYSPNEIRSTYMKNLKIASQKILLTIQSEHPEYFWLNNIEYGYVYAYDNSGIHEITKSFIKIKTYKYSNKQVKKFNSQIKQALKSIKKNRKSSSQKDTAVSINNYVCRRVSYSTTVKRRENAYTALIKKKAVCEGYSKLYTLLCNKFKINTLISNGTFENQKHMWTYSKINGTWFLNDVTFNDGTGNKYLLVKDKAGYRRNAFCFSP